MAKLREIRKVCRKYFKICHGIQKQQQCLLVACFKRIALWIIFLQESPHILDSGSQFQPVELPDNDRSGRIRIGIGIPLEFQLGKVRVDHIVGPFRRIIGPPGIEFAPRRAGIPVRLTVLPDIGEGILGGPEPPAGHQKPATIVGPRRTQDVTHVRMVTPIALRTGIHPAEAVDWDPGPFRLGLLRPKGGMQGLKQEGGSYER